MGYKIKDENRPRDAGTVNGWKITEHPTAREDFRFQAVLEGKNQRFVRSARSVGELGIATGAGPRAALSQLVLASGALLGGRP